MKRRAGKGATQTFATFGMSRRSSAVDYTSLIISRPDNIQWKGARVRQRRQRGGKESRGNQSLSGVAAATARVCARNSPGSRTAWMKEWTGVGTPTVAPIRTTAPDHASSSEGRPASISR